MTRVFVSLGSNIEPEKNILGAIRLLSRQVRILKASPVYLTKPLLNRRQPSYYNCVVEIETNMEPRRLKSDVLAKIEDKLGRKRTGDKYASRTIDLDILIYGDLEIREGDLNIPDPEIEERAFLAIALRELDPGLVIPGNKSISEVTRNFSDQGLTELTDFTSRLRRLIDSLGVEQS